MGVRLASVATTTILGSVPGSGAETVLCTTPPINLTLDNAQVQLYWYVELILGTIATVGVLRLRRGSTVGSTVLGLSANFTITPSTTILQAGCYVDSPGIVAEQQYSLTFQTNGGGTATTTQDVCLIATVL